MLCAFLQKRKRELTIGAAMLFIIFCISIISFSKFLWWMVYSLYLEIKFWKLLIWSSFNVLKVLSYNLFIEWLDCVEQNIQTKGQYLNCDLLLDLHKRFFTLIKIVLNCAELWPAFAHKVLIWLLKVSFRSIFIPGIVFSFLFFRLNSSKLKVSSSLVFLARHL